MNFEFNKVLNNRTFLGSLLIPCTFMMQGSAPIGLDSLGTKPGTEVEQQISAKPAVVQIKISNSVEIESDRQKGLVRDTQTGTIVTFSAADFSTEGGDNNCYLLPDSISAEGNSNQNSSLERPSISVNGKGLPIRTSLYTSESAGSSPLIADDPVKCAEKILSNSKFNKDGKGDSKAIPEPLETKRGLLDNLPRGRLKVSWLNGHKMQTREKTVLFTGISASKHKQIGYVLLRVDRGFSDDTDVDTQGFSTSVFTGSPVVDENNRFIGQYQPLELNLSYFVGGKLVKQGLLNQARELNDSKLVGFINQIPYKELNGGVVLALVKYPKVGNQYEKLWSQDLLKNL